MDSTRLPKSKYVRGKTISLSEVIVEQDKLYTRCPSGLFEARFENAEAYEVASRKKKTKYLRLEIRFRLSKGPLAFDGKRWDGDNEFADRLVAIWAELARDEEGRPILSPNLWWAKGSNKIADGGLSNWLRAHFCAVDRVVVKKKPGKPAHVCDVIPRYNTVSPERVARLTKGCESSD